MNVYQLIAALEGELVEKRGQLRKKVDTATCYDLCERLKESLPESIEEANFILANKQKILLNADTAAKNTIREAEDRASHMLDNAELRRRSEHEARRLIDDTNVKCDNLVQRTKEHLDGVFKDLEQFLVSALSLIRRNRDELNGMPLLGSRE
ncbi:MAG: hypothetical protein FWC80_07280 [Firmicutes bacterium]|nr:hypothetical protein [Bacillota bacterium]